MQDELNQEEIDKAIRETEEKVKRDKDIFSSERKAALTWNIIFFIGILTTTFVVSLFSKSDGFNLKEFFTSKSDDKVSLWASIVGLLISFIIGILASYFKTKKLKDKDKFDVEDFIKESFISRLDKSKLNPKSNRL